MSAVLPPLHAYRAPVDRGRAAWRWAWAALAGLLVVLPGAWLVLRAETEARLAREAEARAAAQIAAATVWRDVGVMQLQVRGLAGSDAFDLAAFAARSRALGLRDGADAVLRWGKVRLRAGEPPLRLVQESRTPEADAPEAFAGLPPPAALDEAARTGQLVQAHREVDGAHQLLLLAPSQDVARDHGWSWLVADEAALQRVAEAAVPRGVRLSLHWPGATDLPAGAACTVAPNGDIVLEACAIPPPADPRWVPWAVLALAVAAIVALAMLAAGRLADAAARARGLAVHRGDAERLARALLDGPGGGGAWLARVEDGRLCAASPGNDAPPHAAATLASTTLASDLVPGLEASAAAAWPPGGRRLAGADGRVLDIQALALGRPARAHWLLREATSAERGAQAPAVERLAPDPLTGLPGRLAFGERLAAALASPVREGLAVVAVDVAGLGMLNAVHGSAEGDALLAGLAVRLREALDDGEHAARIEDDTFAVLLRVATPDALADRVAGLLARLHDCERLRPSGGSPLPLWVAAGWLSPQATRPDADLLPLLADALGQAKRDLASPVYVRLDGEDPGGRAADAAWLSDLREAMAEGRLVLFAQRLGGGREPHAEVLLRLRTRDGGIVPPGAFLGIAERYELIREIDRYVLERVCERLPALLEQFTGDAANGVIAVNLSARSLSDRGLAGFLSDLVARTGADPRRLCLEITETAALVDLQRTVELVGELRARGFRIAIDDFGVGLASFQYLVQVPADYVKIDGSFVRDITRSALSRRIVQAITDIGHGMGLEVVAEWVSSEEIRSALDEVGVDLLQGFVLHRPEMADFERGPA